MSLLVTPLFAQPAPEESEPVDRTIIVGTKEAVPFAIRGERGEWRGISIELLDQVMHDLGWDYEVRSGSLERLLDDVSSGELDLAISAITITAEREVDHDFSQGYFSSGLGIAVASGGGGWKGFVRRLFSPQLTGAVGVTILFLLVVGWLAWLAERKANPEQFGGGLMRGVWEGFWFSAVTMTTVGYGDRAPVTRAGRALALIWMFTSLVAISSLTAAITSALTLNELDSGIGGPADLPKVRVGTVAASTSVAYLNNRGISAREFATAEEALEALSTGEVEAVVYDGPILRYRINEDYPGELSMLPELFDKQSYGVVFGSRSPLRESFNRALLEALESAEWRQTVTRYLGSTEP